MVNPLVGRPDSDTSKLIGFDVTRTRRRSAQVPALRREHELKF